MVGYNILFCTVLWLSYAASARGYSADVKNDPDPKDTYPLFTTGVENLLKASDPVSIEYIKAVLPTINYENENSVITGLKDATIPEVNINKETGILQFSIFLPKFELKSQCSILGYLFDKFIEGEGAFSINAENYLFTIKGFYKTKTTKDKKIIFIKKYLLDVEPKDRVVYSFKNLYYGDTEKADAMLKLMHDNYLETDKNLRAPSLYAFMDIFMNNLNNYITGFPVEDLFPELA